MTATVFRQRIKRKNAILVFIQSKKIFLLERWAGKKWVQLSFSSAIPCGITRAITAATGSQPSHPTPCLAAILIPQIRRWAPTREILVEAQISDPLAFHFLLPGKRLLVVLEGNFEPAETGTWLPKDFLGYTNVSGFSLVSADFLRTLFRFLFSCEFLCEEKLNFSVDTWFWSCLDWCCTAVYLDLEFYFFTENIRKWWGSAAYHRPTSLFTLLQLHQWKGATDSMKEQEKRYLVPGDAFLARGENRGYH